MSLPILSVAINREHDTVDARQRARQISRLLGFDAQDQTRISTAVSEIARNAFNYANGGKVDYWLEGCTSPQLFIVCISDHGPGISDLSAILEGRYQSRTGMGLGIAGSRRLMDQFQIDSVPGQGTTVLLKKLLPKQAPVITEADLPRLTDALARERPRDALQELRHQNQELLRGLEEINTRQTELARLNRELEDTNRGVVALYAELDEKADYLRRADELKSRFLSNMSHEFRSPLNSIIALAGLLLNHPEGGLTGDQEQQANYIRRAATDLLELVNDLLDTAKVEAGKVDVRPVEFAVPSLFAALRAMLRPLLLNQSVNLIFENPSSLPPLYSDEGKISQILRNFISNALKFTEKGEVRVAAECVGETEIRFSVADTGIGISPGDQEAIFQDFVQLDHPIQRRVTGTGLGLPLSKKLATLLGGGVAVDSCPGAGSTFSLRLPIRYAAPAPQPPAALNLEVPDPSLLPVLFVEDNPETLLAYKVYLENSGFHPVFVATAREADRVLERVQPAVIVLDIAPRAEPAPRSHDTWVFIARLKQDPRTRNTPLLVACALEDRDKAFHLGVSACIVKPVTAPGLLAELCRLARNTPGARVLVVDDNELDRYILRHHLLNLPVAIFEAESGTACLRQARDVHPNLIFLDLTMPDMTGFEVVEALKNAPETMAIPIVIVSSRILTGQERALLAGKTVTIMGKEGLSEAAVHEVVRRTLKLAASPSLEPK